MHIIVEVPGEVLDQVIKQFNFKTAGKKLQDDIECKYIEFRNF